MATLTWNPLAQQTDQIDTLFKPDLTSQATINASGGFLQGAQVPQPQLVGRYNFGAGKFGPAVRAISGQADSVFFPVDGLLDGTEFTFEYWQKLDGLWANHSSGKALMALNSAYGGNSITLFNFWQGGSTCRAEVWGNVPTKRISLAWSASVSSLGLIDGQFNQFAVTYKGTTLKFYVNGVEKGQITGMTLLNIWSDGTKEEGIMLGGEPGNTNGVWTSDPRASMTERIPSTSVTLRSTTGTMAVNATASSTAVPPKFSGALKIYTTAPRWPTEGSISVADAQAALSNVREADTITVTPIKAGGTDGTHPTAGASGSFSYDWQVIDRSLAWWNARGLEIYLNADATPQILGGTVAPDITKPFIGSTYDNHVPSNFADFAKIISDMILHAIATGRRIDRIGHTNEPDLGTAFWNGTIPQLADLYAAWAPAAKTADSTIQVGAGELAGVRLSTAYVDAFMVKKAAGTPMDFFSFHDYVGSLEGLDQARAIVEYYAGIHATGAPKVVMGEYNWTDINTQAGVSRFATATENGKTGFWYLRAITAAYTTAYHIHAMEVGNIDRICWAHTGPTYGTPRDNQAQLVGDNGEHWATFNALKGWKLAAAERNICTTTKTLPPGVYGLATKDPAANRFGLVLSNYGWANRSTRTVDTTFSNLPAGNYRLRRYVVDETRSSRWDFAEDDPSGATHDALELVEDRIDTAANFATISLSLPRWSATFVTLDIVSGGADTTPPDTTLDTFPSSGTSTSASFTFHASETSTFEVRLDGGAWTSATSPKSYTGLAIGTHTFDVRATDTAGNLETVPATYTWQVQGVPPPGGAYFDEVMVDTPTRYYRLSESTGSTTTVDEIGGAAGTASLVNWGVAGALPGDGDTAGSFAPNAFIDLPAYTISTNGSWELWFKTGSIGAVLSLFDSATNIHMNIAVSPRLIIEVYDGTAWNYADGPFGKDDSVWHHVVATKAGANLVLYCDGASVATKTLPSSTLTVADAWIGASGTSQGSSWFTGSIDEVAFYSTTLSGARVLAHYNAAAGGAAADTTPPDTTFTVKPSAGPATTVSFSFTANEPATFETRIDGGAWTSATSPKTYSGLSVGVHTVDVRATDTSANVDPTPDTHTWTVTAPPPPGPSTTSELLWFTDDRIGIVPNQPGVDQGSKLQQAIDLALSGDGDLHGNPGEIENRSVELTYSQGAKTVHFICNNTTIRYPVDLGVDKYPIRPAYGAFEVDWEGITFRGPETRSGFGQDMSDMWGPRVHGRSNMEQVHVSGFRTGMFLSGDHHMARDCNWRGNSFGLYAADNLGGGGGDWIFDHVHMDSNRKASIGIGTTHALGGATLIGCHLGFSPFGIYRFEEGGPQRYLTFLADADFIRCAFEACGLGVIFDEPGDGTIEKVTMVSAGSAGEASFSWAGKSRNRGLWDVGNIQNVTITSEVAPWFDNAQGFDLPMFYAVNRITNCWFRDAEYAGHNVYEGAGHKLLSAPWIEDIWIGGPGARGGRAVGATVVNTTETLSRFDAVELTATDFPSKVRKARNAAPYLGQVAAPAAANTSAFVLTSGFQGTWIRARVSANVKTGQPLIVDAANPGMLKHGGVPGDHAVVAYAVTDITGGTDGQVKIVNSPAS